jgi:hypothetical protein
VDSDFGEARNRQLWSLCFVSPLAPLWKCNYMTTILAQWNASILVLGYGCQET